MFRNFLAKVVILLGTTAALLSVNETCLAAQGTGKIIIYLLDGRVTDRGACIQMNPPLAGTWACVFTTSALYDQLNDLLRYAYLYGKDCLVDYETSNTSVNAAQCM
jgi:hypothetical protein